jgi:glycosyltransferase involved in cell wall biosynthesis
MEDSVFRRSHTTVSINERIRYRLQKRSRDMMDASRHRIITHGYDPEDFPRDTSARERGDRMRIVYTGVFYDAQKPDVFLRGLARFLRVSPGSRDRISARFVGLLPKSTGRLIGELDLSDVVHHSGYVSHADTVEEMRSADVLWMTIGRRSGSHGISTGKLYEYFGARKPILGLVPEGVARESLIDYGAAQIAEPDDPDDVAVALAKLFKQWESGLLPDPDHDFVDRFNRKVLAARLADILNKATGAA